MIDNIKISLNGFTGSFDNCSLRPNAKEWENYFLYRSNKSNAPLALGYHIPSHRLNIRGSIRKWYFEDTSSTQDLSIQQAKEAFEEVAELLLISFEELRQGHITQCELGLNIPLRSSASVFTSTLVAYSTYEIEQRDGSVTFYRKDRYRDKERRSHKRNAWKQKVACIYDKLAEVASKSTTRKKDKQASVVAKAKNILRIEFIMPNRQAFKTHKIGHCSILGGLLDSYGYLYEVWAKEYKKLFFQSKLDRNSLYLANEAERDIVDHLEKKEQFFLTLEHFNDLSVQDRAQVKAQLQSIISLATTGVAKMRPPEKWDYPLMYIAISLREEKTLGGRLKTSLLSQELSLVARYQSKLSTSTQSRINKVKREISRNNKGKKYADSLDNIA